MSIDFSRYLSRAQPIEGAPNFLQGLRERRQQEHQAAMQARALGAQDEIAARGLAAQRDEDEAKRAAEAEKEARGALKWWTELPDDQKVRARPYMGQHGWDLNPQEERDAEGNPTGRIKWSVTRTQPAAKAQPGAQPPEPKPPLPATDMDGRPVQPARAPHAPQAPAGERPTTDKEWKAILEEEAFEKALDAELADRGVDGPDRGHARTAEWRGPGELFRRGPNGTHILDESVFEPEPDPGGYQAWVDGERRPRTGDDERGVVLLPLERRNLPDDSVEAEIFRRGRLRADVADATKDANPLRGDLGVRAGGISSGAPRVEEGEAPAGMDRDQRELRPYMGQADKETPEQLAELERAQRERDIAESTDTLGARPTREFGPGNTFSSQTIAQLETEKSQPSLEQRIGLYDPQDQPVVREAVKAILASGLPQEAQNKLFEALVPKEVAERHADRRARMAAEAANMRFGAGVDNKEEQMVLRIVKDSTDRFDLRKTMARQTALRQALDKIADGSATALGQREAFMTLIRNASGVPSDREGEFYRGAQGWMGRLEQFVNNVTTGGGEMSPAMVYQLESVLQTALQQTNGYLDGALQQIADSVESTHPGWGQIAYQWAGAPGAQYEPTPNLPRRPQSSGAPQVSGSVSRSKVTRGTQPTDAEAEDLLR